MTHTLSPEDTGEIARPLTWPGDGPTRIIPRSPLPRPDLADTKRILLPPRMGILLPDRTEQITLLSALGGEPEQPRARRSVPASELLACRAEWTGPKHRRPSWLARLFGGAR